MNKSIFCPSNHLILDLPSCPICGWQRPPETKQGALLWKPVRLNAGIGGPAQESFSRPGVANGVAVYPLRSGELVGISQKDGRILWQSQAAPELYPRHLHSDGSGLIGVVADNRSLEKAENGYIVQIDPQTGKTERTWEGYGFTMTEPVFTDSLLIVRTAHAKLVALDRNAGYKVAWETPLKTYKPISPVIAGDLVLAWDGEVTKEQMTLKAFAIQDGSLVWQTNIADIDCVPVIAGNQMIYRSGKRQITSIDINKGDLRWQKDFSRIYSIPSAAEKKLYLMICGDADTNSPAHYSLQCLNADSGTPEWLVPLGIRAQEILCQPDGTLLVGMGDPIIAVCSSQNGSILWQYSFGEEKVNRIQTHLVVQDGICWVGTYEGVAAAFQISENSGEIEDPEKFLAQGNYEGAAEALAFRGELKKSAEIYLNQLNQPQKAAALYEKLNDIPGQVAVLLNQGDELTAARLLEKNNQLVEAARLFEQANELRTAMRIYQTLGCQNEVSRLRKLVPLELDDIEALVKEGKLVEAGDAAMRLKEFRKAFDLFEQSGDELKDEAFDALSKLCEVSPEPWAWEKLANLARRLGHFQEQAKAHEKLGNCFEAAEAFNNAAQQMEQRSPQESKAIADLFEQAHKYYELEGVYDKQLFCKNKIIIYRKLPRIQVTGKTDKAFRELEFNALNLTVKNIGRGRADDVVVQVQGDRFEVDINCLPEKISHLGANLERSISLSIRPLKEQVGEVPFVLEWKWKDLEKNEYRDKTIVEVSVKQQNDSRNSGTPVIINNTGGTIYQGSDYHKEISGDNVEAGGHIGDNLEVVHSSDSGKKVGYRSGELNGQKIIESCPNCSLPIDKDAKYCDACGYKLLKGQIS